MGALCGRDTELATLCLLSVAPSLPSPFRVSGSQRLFFEALSIPEIITTRLIR